MVPLVIPVGGGGGDGKRVKTGTISGSGTRELTIPCDFSPANIIVAYDLGRTADVSANRIYNAWKIGTADSGWSYESGGSHQHRGVDVSLSYSGGNVTITVTTSASTAVFYSDWTYNYMLAEE